MTSAIPLPSQYAWLLADLAPGSDQDEAVMTDGLAAWCIRSAADPRFAGTHGELAREFGPLGEMEPERMIRERLARGVHQPRPGWCTLYELAAVELQGKLLGVRDVNAIARVDRGAPFAVVHLSHVLVTPAWRGRGLAAWLRAFPLQTARRALAALGAPEDSPVVLVGEMEHPQTDPVRLNRLRSYGRASFRAIDPRGLDYHQPDFREPAEVEAAGVARPLPMRLVVRRVGRESEPDLPWSEVLTIVESLYGMYALDFRWSDIEPLWRKVQSRPVSADTAMPLVDPLQ